MKQIRMLAVSTITAFVFLTAGLCDSDGVVADSRQQVGKGSGEGETGSNNSTPWPGKKINYVQMNPAWFAQLKSEKDIPIKRMSTFRHEMDKGFAKFIFEAIDLKDLFINMQLYIKGQFANDAPLSEKVDTILAKIIETGHDSFKDLFSDQEKNRFIRKNLKEELTPVENYFALLGGIAFFDAFKDKNIFDAFFEVYNRDDIGKHDQDAQLKQILKPSFDEASNNTNIKIENYEINIFLELLKSATNKLNIHPSNADHP